MKASAVFASLMLLAGCALEFDTKSSDDAYSANNNWAYYHGNPAGTHHSALADINVENVQKLELAWIYDTGDRLTANSTIESNPLVIDNRLFFISPNGRLICLDASTGRERWVFNPGARSPGGVSAWRRGVSYWTEGKDERVLFTFGNDLYSVDATTGAASNDFGIQGKISLGDRVSTPGAVYKDLIIVGGSSSTIRAFNVRTGRQIWTFHTIPRPGEFGYETWPRDGWINAKGANNWAGLTLDAEQGVVFAPLAFPQNYYGAQRVGDNLFANCLVALDANTGRRLWHFQTIRHDLWDWDLPAAPTLVKVIRDGRPVDAVAQVTKTGFVYVLDRVTGESLFPLAEKPTFPSDVPGEVVARTQPEPQKPRPFTRQHVTVDMLTQRTPEANTAAKAQFAKLRSRGLWDPPSEQGTILFPGTDGGAEWGGAAYDPDNQMLYVNANEWASILTLKRVSSLNNGGGSSIYGSYCASCHGNSREGLAESPSLIGIQERLTFDQLAAKIQNGGGRMPAFAALANDPVKLWGLIEYLQTGVEHPLQKPPLDEHMEAKLDYVIDGLPRFVDPEGYPATAPPWGTLNAIDLNTGEYVWKIAFGEYPKLVAQGMRNTGSENYGGPIVTAGGLLFIGATSFDKKFRAYDKRTGKLLWETVLPAAGNATPSTYRVNGRQFVVIAAGGGRPPTAELGSKIVAFALPN